MAFAPQIRKYILRALDQFIIPALQKETVTQILAAPPYDFSQVEHWTLRNSYLPHRTPEITQMIWAWKKEHMVTSRMEYIGFVYEGKADEKIGITTKMAKAQANSPLPRGVTAVRLAAPAVVCFPPGAPRRDGSGPFCETGRPGFAASQMIWIFVAIDEILVHYCESDTDTVFSSPSLSIQDGILAQLAHSYVEELHYAHQEGNEAPHALLLVLMKRLRRYLTTHPARISNTEWPSHDLLAFRKAQSGGEYLCQKAVEYIVTHLQDPITREMLAAHLECSPFYLNRIFQKFTGMPVMRYVTFRRIEAAKLLLAQDHQRVGEIARYTGFANIDSFSACFKRLVGCNPREFRHQIKQPGAATITSSKKMPVGKIVKKK